jgi:hypothetical protein
MSDTAPTDQDLSGLLGELAAARKSGEEIWEQRNECFYKLRETTGEVEREIIKEELKKLNALCASAIKKCHTLQSRYTWLLYQLGVADYDYRNYCCYDDYDYRNYCCYDDYDERDGPVTGDYS